MRELSLNKYKIKPVKKKAFNIKTPPDELQLHQLNFLVGVRGGGKSLAIFSKMKQLQDQDLCDRLFIISPTAISNKEFIDMLEVKPEDIYDKPHADSLLAVIEKCEQEKRDWDEYNRLVKQHKLIKKMLRSRKTLVQVNQVWEELLAANPNAESIDDILEEPQWKYDTVRPPVLHCVIDDCLGTPLFSTKTTSPFINFLIRHRHIAEGLGCSVWMAVQTYTAQAGGMPKPVRENATSICLFKTKNEATLKKIADEVGEAVDKDLFLEAYRIATSKPYGFLLVDFHPKDPKKYTFRRGWDDLLILDDDEVGKVLTN